MPFFEGLPESAGDRHNTRGASDHPSLACVETLELRGRRGPVRRVQPGVLLGENRGNRVRFVNHGKRRYAQREVGDDQIAGEEKVPLSARAQ